MRHLQVNGLERGTRVKALRGAQKLTFVTTPPGVYDGTVIEVAKGHGPDVYQVFFDDGVRDFASVLERLDLPRDAMSA